VYNALYLWKKRGWHNSIATTSGCDGFHDYIDQVYPVTGKWTQVARQLAGMDHRFDVMIVYEPADVEAFSLSTLYGANWKYRHLLHHSLEVPAHLDHIDSIKKYFHKLLFQYGLNKTDNIIIQDSVRLNVLEKIFPNVKMIKSTFVPNTYIESIEPISDQLPWFDRIREKSKPLVLYTGAIERWALSADILESIKEMEEASFLFSGWSRDGFLEELEKKYKGHTNIYFHGGIKSRTDLNYMVSKSDIGLAYYIMLDDNVRYIGMSSGKINKYLTYGKPVVVNKMQDIASIMEEKAFGKSATIETMAGSINHIMENYEMYRQNIREKFLKEYDFEAPYLKLIDELDKN